LPPAVVICGPTASGKTDAALALARRFPVHLISADSVQVYRGMDIGSAKPGPDVLGEFPHALIDIRDPEQGWSAAEFARLAGREMRAAQAGGRVPVLVGGTAMHLRALRYGLDALPAASPALRARLLDEARRHGWPALHRRLEILDPETAARIAPGDAQRIQRALEIRSLTGSAASTLRLGRGPDRLRGSLHLVLAPVDRTELHARINARFSAMLEAGLEDEARALLARPGLSPDAPALRAVGYRQVVDCLNGQFPRRVLAARGAAATRQLAKRQLTAFRQWPGGLWYDPLNKSTSDRIINRVGNQFG